MAKVEVVLFPEAWKQYAPLVQKGSPVLVRAKLQQGDEDVKLLADQLLALNDPQLKAKAARRPASAAASPGGRGPRPAPAPAQPAAAAKDRADARPVPQAAAKTGAPAQTPGSGPPSGRPANAPPGAGTASRPAAQPREEAPAVQAAPAKPRPAASAARTQRVYVKISASHEQPHVLAKLKELLLEHEGPLDVILYYEKSQKTLRLSEQYQVKPSPELFRMMEELLGKETVKVK
ncbi:hypothetical protein ACHHV8_25100 [Paenibacillus sp. TAB 01]|uniref:hypothetical protein n=1 Tax=Paenibacillus sp. TAB 01 TaxID=3368988 RepID=UPI003751CA4B